MIQVIANAFFQKHNRL